MTNNVPFNRKAIRQHIDECITLWREKKAAAENDADMWVAVCYIDAYQSMRLSIFGELLPK